MLIPTQISDLSVWAPLHPPSLGLLILLDDLKFSGYFGSISCTAVSLQLVGTVAGGKFHPCIPENPWMMNPMEVQPTPVKILPFPSPGQAEVKHFSVLLHLETVSGHFSPTLTSSSANSQGIGGGSTWG